MHPLYPSPKPSLRIQSFWEPAFSYYYKSPINYVLTQSWGQIEVQNWFLSPQAQFVPFSHANCMQLCWLWGWRAENNDKQIDIVQTCVLWAPILIIQAWFAGWAHVRTWLALPFHFTCNAANRCHVGGFTFRHGMLLRGYLYNLPLLIPRLSHIGRNIQD